MKIISYRVGVSGIVVLLKCPPRPLYITVWYQYGMREPSGSVCRKSLQGGKTMFARVVNRHGISISKRRNHDLRSLSS